MLEPMLASVHVLQGDVAPEPISLVRQVRKPVFIGHGSRLQAMRFATRNGDGGATPKKGGPHLRVFVGAASLPSGGGEASAFELEDRRQVAAPSMPPDGEDDGVS